MGNCVDKKNVDTPSEMTCVNPNQGQASKWSSMKSTIIKLKLKVASF